MKRSSSPPSPLSKILISVLAVFTLGIFIGCSNSEIPITEPDPALNRVSFVSGETELIIEKSAARSAFTPQSGDSYKLLVNEVLKSWGTVTISGTIYTFTPSADAGSALEFTATLSSGILTEIGEITLSDGTTKDIPDLTWGPAGTWQHYNVKLIVEGTFEGGTWETSDINTGEIFDSGRYTSSGNTYTATSTFKGGAVVAYASFISSNLMRVTIPNDGIYMYERVSP